MILSFSWKLIRHELPRSKIIVTNIKLLFLEATDKIVLSDMTRNLENTQFEIFLVKDQGLLLSL